jgi:predicted lipoprotein with Yx(FWY)xxD motif
MTRDVALRLKYLKPSLIHSKFIPALQVGPLIVTHTHTHTRAGISTSTWYTYIMDQVDESACVDRCLCSMRHQSRHARMS